jgi:hypothetical protein
MTTTFLDIHPKARGETHYTAENIALANAVLSELEQAGWLISIEEASGFKSAAAYGSHKGRIMSLYSFSAMGKGKVASAGSFALSFGRDLWDKVVDAVISPEGCPTQQAKAFIERVNARYDDPLSQQDYQGLGLFSPVKLNGVEYIIGNALFNDKSVTLFTRRDFDSFPRDIDGVTSSVFKNGRWEYQGKDAPMQFSIKQLEEVTGRIWGRRLYKRKSAALTALKSLPRCILIERNKQFCILPSSRLSHCIQIPEFNIVAVGSETPAPKGF